MQHRYNYTIKLYNPLRKDGTRALYFMANINGQRVRLPMHLYIPPSQYDPQRQRATHGPTAEAINASIDAYTRRALEIFTQARLLGKPLDKARFIYLMQNEHAEKDFLLYMSDAIQRERERMSPATVKSYWKTYRLLQRFNTRLPITAMDTTWARKWDGFLRSTPCSTGPNKGRPLSENTITSHHKRISKFFDLAIDELSLHLPNPLKKLRYRYIDGHRAFLTPAELHKFVRLYDKRKELALPEHLTQALRQFLFMVGSGLRISDTGHLYGLSANAAQLTLRVQKTRRWKMHETFPLSDFSRRYLDDRGGYQFAYRDCQTLNTHLRTLCQYLNIPKHITSHSARHTFATTFLIAGGKVEVLQRLLSHGDIRTTMKYVHLLQDTERQQLALLDEFLNF